MLSIYSAQGAKKQGGGKLTLNDFLPDYCKTKSKLTPQQKEEQLKAMFKALANRK